MPNQYFFCFVLFCFCFLSEPKRGLTFYSTNNRLKKYTITITKTKINKYKKDKRVIKLAKDISNFLIKKPVCNLLYPISYNENPDSPPVSKAPPLVVQCL